MHTRKNFLVDARRVRRLARKLATSESGAVRRAIDALLVREEAEGYRADPAESSVAHASSRAERPTSVTLADVLEILRLAPEPDDAFAGDVACVRTDQPAALEAFRRWPS